jgi:hypothetical protein
MALTSFQRSVCRLLAGNRLRSGESYVAGGTALNTLLRAPRLSRDIDLFHDTEEALAAAWTADRNLLERERYALSVIRERPTFVEAEVARGDESVVVQWADFEGETPDAAALALRWKASLETAREILGLLRGQEPGRAVLAQDGTPYRGSPDALRAAIQRNELLYHEGCIRGAFPRIVR